jgi:hypothetical protein
MQIRLVETQYRRAGGRRGLPKPAGAAPKKSAGHGKLIFAMKVDDKLSPADDSEGVGDFGGHVSIQRSPWVDLAFIDKALNWVERLT